MLVCDGMCASVEAAAACRQQVASVCVLLRVFACVVFACGAILFINFNASKRRQPKMPARLDQLLEQSHMHIARVCGLPQALSSVVNRRKSSWRIHMCTCAITLTHT
jgi:hypothetical protein